jgi:MoaA/NifB/PqqE/SkfB family radical SAM enzyme
MLKYAASIVFRNVWVSRFPFALSIEPTNHCQLSCAECPTGMKELSRRKGYMNIELYEKLIKSVYKHSFYVNLYFQGEPLLHPQIEQMITIARKHRIYIVLSTNGQSINEEMAEKLVISGLSKIIISMDGFSNETYTQYRKNGDVEKVKSGIIALIQAKKMHRKKKPKIIVKHL